MEGKQKLTPLLLLFLAVELVLYYLILTAGGDLLRWSSYIAIVLCFLYAAVHCRRSNWQLVGGLFFTVCADFCLVICQPIQQLWGMVFFLCAQTLYCRHLHHKNANKLMLTIRMFLIGTAILICFIVLKKKTDALAVISICYYAHLIMNIVDATLGRKRSPLLPAAFILFILCDTVIGLQVMSSGYIPISQESILHKILFCNFNLSWLFYLPSQVLIAISSHKQK